MRPEDGAGYGRGAWNVWLWIVLGLIFWVLSFSTSSGPRSPYWASELVLYGLMLGGMWANHKRRWSKPIQIPKPLAPLAYVSLVWLFGMLFELSLTVTGEGVGGLHSETWPSFILAQGDYILIAVVSYLVISRTHATYRDAFFFAGGKSLTEGLVFSPVLASLVVSPSFWLAPFALAYYTLAYASFIALPLLFVDEQLLWKDSFQPKMRSVPFYWVLGFVLALAIRLVWGLIYGPLVTQLFHLPPGP
jgi:hypothetical protein